MMVVYCLSRKKVSYKVELSASFLSCLYVRTSVIGPENMKPEGIVFHQTRLKVIEMGSSNLKSDL